MKKFKPLGNRIIVKPDPILKKTESGLLVSYADNEKLEEGARILGTVIAVGKMCWADYWHFEGYEPWCVPGDRVYWAKYAGKTVVHPETKELYVALNDIDVVVGLEDVIEDELAA